MNINNQPQISQSISYTSAKKNTNNNSKNHTIAYSAAGAVSIGVTAAIVGGLTKKSRLAAFEKAGLELKDKIVYVKETGEKFTGSIKRNVSAFGLKKEVTNIEDGVLKEILNYGFRGKELDGYFYKDGKLLYSSGNPVSRKDGKKIFPYYKHDERGGVTLFADAFAKKGESIFEHMRKITKKDPYAKC